MKNILKFAFAVVAMACVVFASASCGKDDEGEEITQEMWYNSHEPGDPFFDYEKTASLRPHFVEIENYYGYEFDVKWTKAEYDTIQFEYELCWSYKETNYKEYHSLGRQKDNVFHFSVDDNGIEFPGDYQDVYLILNTYYWHNGHERRVQGYGSFRKMLRELANVDYSDNNIHITFFNGQEDRLSHIKKIVVLLVDLNDEGEATKVYKSFHYDSSSSTLQSEVSIEDIYPEWSGYLDIQFFNLDGSYKTMCIKKIEK